MTDYMELIDAYAEARHKYGSHTYNTTTADARKAVEEFFSALGAGGVERLRSAGEAGEYPAINIKGFDSDSDLACYLDEWRRAGPGADAREKFGWLMRHLTKLMHAYVDADRAARAPAPAAVEPVAWLHTNRLGGVQVFTTEPPPGLKERCQPLFASPKASPADALDADMYWDDADPEMGYESIGELLDNMISHGGHEVGDTLTLQRAHRLPNITIRITSIDDEEGDSEYEVIDAAMAAQGAKT